MERSRVEDRLANHSSSDHLGEGYGGHLFCTGRGIRMTIERRRWGIVAHASGAACAKTTPPLFIPKAALSARNPLAAREAEIPRDKAALRNDNSFRIFKLHPCVPKELLDRGRSASAKSHAITVKASCFIHQPFRSLLHKLPRISLAQSGLVRIERLEA